VAIVGSTSPAGKQLRELLEADTVAWKLHLLDTDEYAGLLQEFGGEIGIVQVISPERLRDADAAVFTCAPAFLDEYVTSGAYLPPVTVDATGGDRAGPAFIARHPHAARAPGSERRIQIAAGAETTILARLLTTLDEVARVESCHATVIASAADRGIEFMDRLQEETIGILNFQHSGEPTNRLAFNVWGPGEPETRRAARISRQVGAMTPERCPAPAVQVAMAPTFQGTSLSVYVRLSEEVPLDEVLARLAASGDAFRSAPGATPLDVLGTDRAAIANAAEGAEPGAFWLWVTADGLRVTAQNAMELIRRSTFVGA
jgi:aspartate-semialdehyde dehydrogenase